VPQVNPWLASLSAGLGSLGGSKGGTSSALTGTGTGGSGSNNSLASLFGSGGMFGGGSSGGSPSTQSAYNFGTDTGGLGAAAAPAYL
jgi:hypothetical protein